MSKWRVTTEGRSYRAHDNNRLPSNVHSAVTLLQRTLMKLYQYKKEVSDMNIPTTDHKHSSQINELKIPVLFLVGLFVLVALVSQIG